MTTFRWLIGSIMGGLLVVPAPANAEEATDPTYEEGNELRLEALARVTLIEAEPGGEDGGAFHGPDGAFGAGPAFMLGWHPLRYFQVAVRAEYTRVEAMDHLRVPLDVAVVVPVGAIVEIQLASNIGLVHQWSVARNHHVEDDGKLRALGVSAGPRVSTSFTMTSWLDAVIESSAAFGFVRTTNGESYLEKLTVITYEVPTGAGLRGRW